MLNSLWAEGTIQCTLLDLEGRTRNEERSVDFASVSRIPEITFFRKERFRFTLRIGKKSSVSPLTGRTSDSQEGNLTFHVFLDGEQRSSCSGSRTFSIPLQPSDPRTGEYSFVLDRIAINNKGTGGVVGWMKIELRFKLIP